MNTSTTVIEWAGITVFGIPWTVPGLVEAGVVSAGS